MTASIAELGGWPAVLGQLAAGNDLDADRCNAVLTEILAGEATDAQILSLIHI